MELEYLISKLIISESSRDLVEHLENDVVIVGAGPSGINSC